MINVTLETHLAPGATLAAAHDFTERRAEVFPAVSSKRLTVHELGDTWADVTEGTRAGPVVVWERCRYDWSEPGFVRAVVTDSNVYGVPGSSWALRAAPAGDGSRVEMIWIREFRRTLLGKVFRFAYRRFGERSFDKYAREVLANIEKLEGRS